MIRQHQREDAQQVYDRTRPPEGTKIIASYFRLFELFQIEEYEQFYKSLIRFIPEVTERSHRSIHEYLIDFSSGDRVSMANVGIITRKRRLMGGVQRIDPKLPDKVDFIALSLYRTIPSIFVVIVDVHLTESAGAELQNIQNRRYLPDVRLFNLFPRSNFFSYSPGNAEAVMEQAINAWSNSIRCQVEIYLQPIFKGFFSRYQRQGRTFPVIEVYAIRGVPEDSDQFKAWEEESFRWYRSLGFNSFANRWKNKTMIFELPESSNWSGISTPPIKARLIVLWEPYIQTISVDHYGNDELSAIKYRTRYILNDVISFIAILAFLNTTQDHIAELKKLTFDTMIKPSSLRASLKLNEQLYWESTLVSIISQDFKAWKQRLGKIHSDEIQQLKYFRVREGNEEDINSNLISMIDLRLERLTQQLSHIELSFSNYLTLRNMRTMYDLQVVAILIAVFAIMIASLPMVSDQLNRLLGLIRTLFS